MYGPFRGTDISLRLRKHRDFCFACSLFMDALLLIPGPCAQLTSNWGTIWLLDNLNIRQRDRMITEK